MRKVLPAAGTLIDEAGLPRLGVFDGEFENLNIYDSTLRVSGLPLPKWWTRFRTKEWFHAGVLMPDSYIGFAVVNTKFLGLSFTSFTRKDGSGAFEHKMRAGASRASVPADMLSSEGGFSAKGYELRIKTALKEKFHEARISIAGSAGKPAVELDLKAHEDPSAAAAMIVSMPVGTARTAYSHKCVVPCEGSVKVGGEEMLGSAKGLMIIDYHRALYPHSMFWRWATCAGWGEDGAPVGLNITKNVNADDWEYNENCWWEGGRMHLLGPAVFEYDRGRIMEPWKVKSADGAVDLVFKPLVLKTETVNAGFIKDDFRQVYGPFNGAVKCGGREFHVRDMFGMCEDHVAKW